MEMVNNNANGDRIFIPYNESTKHIYETFAQVAWEIATKKAEVRAESDASANTHWS